MTLSLSALSAARLGSRALPLAGELLALEAADAIPQGLVALKATANPALSGDELPGRLKLLNWGINATLKGEVKVGETTLKSLSANQDAYGFDLIALDYAHNSLPGHKNYKTDPREVAGYGKVEVVKDDGVYLTSLSYTPSGKANALNYRDLSPTPLLNKDGEVIFMHSVALCPQGAILGGELSFFDADIAGLKALAPDAPLPVTGGFIDCKKLLCALLGLDADNASDDQIAASAQEFARGPKDPTPETAAGATALSVRMDSIERDLILGAALREGKIVPLAARDLPVEKFRALVAELPAGTVPIERQTPGIVALAAPGKQVESAADEAVRVTLGLTKEQWLKHNAA